MRSTTRTTPVRMAPRIAARLITGPVPVPSTPRCATSRPISYRSGVKSPAAVMKTEAQSTERGTYRAGPKTLAVRTRYAYEVTPVTMSPTPTGRVPGGSASDRRRRAPNRRACGSGTMTSALVRLGRIERTRRSAWRQGIVDPSSESTKPSNTAHPRCARAAQRARRQFQPGESATQFGLRRLMWRAVPIWTMRERIVGRDVRSLARPHPYSLRSQW
jgi:hypothetical protein